MSTRAPIDVVIIGGGQAGLIMSYHLCKRGIDHIILEQGRLGETWRSKRWNSFALISPNWITNLPGFPYQGNNPNGFMTRNEVVRYLEAYAASFNPPIQCGVHVTSVYQRANRYIVETTTMGPLEAKSVVIATGAFQYPKVWPIIGERFAEVRHLHSSDYRNVQELAPGSVLVVGSGASGCQIAEELNQSGRKVYLAVSNCGRAPRQYHQRDLFWWLNEIGMFDMTVDQLPSPQAKFSCSPHLGVGHEINLHQLEREGVVLVGRVRAIQESKVIIAPGLVESLNKADQVAADFKQKFDQHMEKMGMQVSKTNDLREMKREQWQERQDISVLDMKTHDVTTVVWATGYKSDYSWVQVPIFDEIGYPRHRRGITTAPGLYFLGIPWLYKFKSALLFGVGEDAAFLAEEIASQLE